ncbi:MAG: helix-turn-helix transcriptional regulator [Chloroflexota bacterium]
MMQEGKYAPLYEYLRQQTDDDVAMTFTEIESLLGVAFPTTARARKAWWSNRRKGGLQATAWMEAGYHAEAVDLTKEQVTFRKQKPRDAYQVKRQGDTVLWDGELVKILREHKGWSQSELAQEMGVRQQTISEWETGMYSPSRAMSKFLGLIAERANFKYGSDEGS